MSKIRIERILYERATRASAAAGYSSVGEFIAHAIENELKRQDPDEVERLVANQLRGLGYLE